MKAPGARRSGQKSVVEYEYSCLQADGRAHSKQHGLRRPLSSCTRSRRTRSKVTLDFFKWALEQGRKAEQLDHVSVTLLAGEPD